jgi:UDP-2-acetamido-3-amino-2,3-dideoxy-glucuronate N-acetyltransferase
VKKGEPLKNELIHFIDCLAARKIPKTSGEEGLSVLRVLEEAERTMQHKSVFTETVPERTTPARDKVSPRPKSSKSYFVHPSSYIDEDVTIGRGTKVWHFSHILKNTKIGERCIIGQGVMIGPDVGIGAGCKIQNNVSVYKGVTLEDDVFCGPSCTFTNVYNPRAFIERKNEFLPTLVKRGATIGAGAIIVCGVTIGEYAFVGAGAVVKRDVPDYALVVGVPAREIGYVCKCGTTLKFIENYAKCTYCSSEEVRGIQRIIKFTSFKKESEDIDVTMG